MFIINKKILTLKAWKYHLLLRIKAINLKYQHIFCAIIILKDFYL